MSRSFRTQKESLVAERRIARTPDGEPCLPRIVVRNPRPGDAHVLDHALIERFLREQPPESFYGLAAIELRARQGRVGRPFASYRGAGKTVIIYSVPPVWTFKTNSTFCALSMMRFGAVADLADGVLTVSWPDGSFPEMWFLFDVLAHELGHHARKQFVHKNGKRGSRQDEERLADRAARRALAASMKQWAQGRSTSLPPT